MGIYLIKCIQPSGFSAQLEASVLALSAASAAAVIIPTLCDASSEPMASGFLFLRFTVHLWSPPGCKQSILSYGHSMLVCTSWFGSLLG